MDAIESIIQTINQEAKTERDRYFVEQKDQTDHSFAQKEKKKQTKWAEKKERQLKKLDKSFQQEKQSLTNQAKAKRNFYKQQLLEETFDEALETMNRWDEETTRHFFLTALANFSKDTKISVQVGNKMAEGILSTQWLEKISQTNGIKLQLTEKSSSVSYGFLLLVGGVQYNFSYQALVEEQKKKKGRMYFDLLFDNKEVL